MKKIIKKIEKYYKSQEVSLFFYPLACLLYESGAKEEAFDLLVEGVAQFPRYLLALIKIAQILIDEEKYEAAESYLETVLNINNSNVLAWELLAFVYEKQNKIEQAINALEKLLVLNPSAKVKSKLLSLASLYTPNVEKVKENLIQNLIQNSSTQKPLEPKETDISNIVILDVEKPVEITKQEETGQNLEQNKPIIFEDIPTIDLEEDDQINIAKLYFEQGYIEDAKNLYKEILTRNPQNEQAKLALEALNAKE